MKIAIIGNYATQFFHKSLLRKLKKNHSDIQMYQSEFNTIDIELLDIHSGLFQFEPDYIIWHESTLGLRDTFYQSITENRVEFALNYQARIEGYLNTISINLPGTKVIFPNHGINFDDKVFGNFSLKVESSWMFQRNKINTSINQLALQFSNFYPMESQPSTNELVVTDYSMVVNAELHFSPDYLDWLSESVLKTIEAFRGQFKKCIILDLDNTLWGGIIGDDGLENIHIGTLGIGKAFTRLQKWLKELKNRGIILAVCSKNNEDIAKSAFEQHPEMVLKLEDIAVFMANWNSKADNINQIQKILNIGFDSMVFIDDNPAEREIVRTHIPKILVPELPLDPADYLPFLISQNIFETVSYSNNDSERTRQYQEESKRVAFSQSITNMDDYLLSLNMRAVISNFQSFDIERIAQLSQRSNQFNLRTKRYSIQDIENIMNNENYLTFSVHLHDKFGSYGLISMVIVKIEENTAFIDTWIMSCRVLKRTVEHLLMNLIVSKLIERKIDIIKGEYLPTDKNMLVEHLLSELAMDKLDEHNYQLKISKYIPLKHFINY